MIGEMDKIRRELAVLKAATEQTKMDVDGVVSRMNASEQRIERRFSLIVALVFASVLMSGIVLARSGLKQELLSPFTYDTSLAGQVENASLCPGEMLMVRVAGHSEGLPGKSSIHRQIRNLDTGAVTTLATDERPYNAGGEPSDFDFYYPVEVGELEPGSYRYEHVVETAVQESGLEEQVIFNRLAAVFEVVDCD